MVPKCNACLCYMYKSKSQIKREDEKREWSPSQRPHRAVPLGWMHRKQPKERGRGQDPFTFPHPRVRKQALAPGTEQQMALQQLSLQPSDLPHQPDWNPPEYPASPA